MPAYSSAALVVSPHFDDAVFSCGEMLAANPGTRILTVFSGQPSTPISTEWDTHCGFPDSATAMTCRVNEDAQALGILGAIPLQGDFLDSQYVSFGKAPTRETIAHSIATALEQHETPLLYIPLGLFHSDHRLVHQACCDVWLAQSNLECIAYEDALYRRMNGLLQERLGDLASRGITATPVPSANASRVNEHYRTMKRQAVEAYASQLKAFGPNGYDDVYCNERFWKLESR